MCRCKLACSPLQAIEGKEKKPTRYKVSRRKIAMFLIRIKNRKKKKHYFVKMKLLMLLDFRVYILKFNQCFHILVILKKIVFSSNTIKVRNYAYSQQISLCKPVLYSWIIYLQKLNRRVWCGDNIARVNSTFLADDREHDKVSWSLWA